MRESEQRGGVQERKLEGGEGGSGCGPGPVSIISVVKAPGAGLNGDTPAACSEPSEAPWLASASVVQAWGAPAACDDADRSESDKLAVGCWSMRVAQIIEPV